MCLLLVTLVTFYNSIESFDIVIIHEGMYAALQYHIQTLANSFRLPLRSTTSFKQVLKGFHVLLVLFVLLYLFFLSQLPVRQNYNKDFHLLFWFLQVDDRRIHIRGLLSLSELGSRFQECNDIIRLGLLILHHCKTVFISCPVRSRNRLLIFEINNLFLTFNYPDMGVTHLR